MKLLLPDNTTYRTTEIIAGGVYTIKSDTELSIWNYMSRTNPLNPRYVQLVQAPCTMRVQGGDGTDILPVSWQEYTNSMNTDEGMRYLIRIGSGWVNKGPWPKVEQLTFCRNQVKVIRVEGNRAYLAHYMLGDRPPVLANDLTMNHYFTVITPDGSVIQPPPGRVMIPFVSSVRDVWIDKDYLK